MKNVKLTLAATLSVLAMSFTSSAFADGMDRQHSKKGFNTTSQVSKQVFKQSSKRGLNQDSRRSSKQLSKNVNRQTFKNANKRKVVKRVIVKKTHGNKVYITKKIVKKRTPARYVMNKRFKQGKKYNKRVSYKNRRFTQDRQNRFKAGKAKKRSVYSVRSGDTLYRISLKTGVSLNKLARMNRLKNGKANYLQIGQVLRLG